MQQSSDRILTTHTGSLPRPPALAEAMVRRERGELDAVSGERLPEMVRSAVADVVARQVRAGIDVVSDGEAGKIGYATYVKERLSGFGGEGVALSVVADLDDFPGLAERALAGLVTATPACVGQVGYTGAAALRDDLASFRAALDGAGVSEAFVPAASPGVISLYLENRHYDSQESYLAALAAAMREEYEAIVDAGFLVQIDSPDLAMGRHTQYARLDLGEFRRRLAQHVEAINEATRGIDPTRVRVHLCWGNYQGPHHHDVALADIVDIVLTLRAQAIVLEASNPRHAHEWRVFEDVRLPDDKLLVPGVIDTSTNYIEHPEVVAERITRYAGVVGRERVIAGTDCGFATFATFLPVMPEIAWAKLAALAEGARLASDRLWRRAPVGAGSGR
ncbi:MAG TPA: cobalamin-independent methionine synthase II family protein [Candidatus Dormibacteraeota bacterium]|nr:cobalamin-independent methionine synthase II family protein [Candidatus Dormibacteraeota bacterium]